MTTIRFYCNSCQQHLQIPADRAGRKVKCGRCQAVVTVPAESEQAETFTPIVARSDGHADRAFAPDEEFARPTRSRPFQAGMVSYIVSGWLMVAAATLLALGLLLVLIAVIATNEGGGPEELAKAGVIVFIIGVFELCLLQLSSIAGNLCCLAAPTSNGCRAMAAITLVSAVGSLIVKVIFLIIPAIYVLTLLFGAPPPAASAVKPPNLFWFIPVWIGLNVEYLFFWLYLRLVGMELQNDKVVSGAVRGLVASLIAVGVGVAGGIVLGLTTPHVSDRGPVKIVDDIDRLLIVGITGVALMSVLFCQGMALVHGASRARAAAGDPPATAPKEQQNS